MSTTTAPSPTLNVGDRVWHSVHGPGVCEEIVGDRATFSFRASRSLAERMIGSSYGMMVDLALNGPEEEDHGDVVPDLKVSALLSVITDGEAWTFEGPDSRLSLDSIYQILVETEVPRNPHTFELSGQFLGGSRAHFEKTYFGERSRKKRVQALTELMDASSARFLTRDIEGASSFSGAMANLRAISDTESDLFWLKAIGPSGLYFPTLFSEVITDIISLCGEGDDTPEGITNILRVIMRAADERFRRGFRLELDAVRENLLGAEGLTWQTERKRLMATRKSSRKESPNE